jgi:hypothetical protein
MLAGMGLSDFQLQAQMRNTSDANPNPTWAKSWKNIQFQKI